MRGQIKDRKYLQPKNESKKYITTFLVHYYTVSLLLLHSVNCSILTGAMKRTLSAINLKRFLNIAF